jgi:hypothetical protein
LDSGNGFWGLWKLDRLYRTDGDEEQTAELERYNRQIEINLGGDACHNLDRIARLAGSVNIPTETKLKKGRTAALAQFWEED